MRVRRGVVLAAGGIAQDKVWRSQTVLHPDSHHSVAPEAAQGDGIKAGLAVGGVLEEGNVNSVFLSPVSLKQRTDCSTAIFFLILFSTGKSLASSL